MLGIGTNATDDPDRARGRRHAPLYRRAAAETLASGKGHQRMVSRARALVVGRGPAGLSAAIALRQAGVDHVQVVELTGGKGLIGSELPVAGAIFRALDTLSVDVHSSGFLRLSAATIG
jgi:NADPH-dependent 2,4-dienoyl-CoA reductase/sulfur reductase-like enzyme